MSYYYDADFSDLIGKTLKKITIKDDHDKDDEIIFECNDGSVYKMAHDQNCCESVDIEDIDGDIQDLIGDVILKAEEINSVDLPPKKYISYEDESWTWTFYKIATHKTSITIRWYGSSNGYYSESVSFVKLEKD